MNKYTVSVVVPIYNTSKYLRRCLNSIVGQTYKDIEVILVDDGSTDESPEICDEYAKKDSRVRTFHLPNGGVSKARNYALDKMTGTWVLFCDSDDWLELNTIEICAQHFEKNDFIRFSSCHVFERDRIDKIVTPIKNKECYLSQLLSRSTGLGVCGGIYKSDLFQDNHIRFNPKLYMGEDWQVLTRLCLKMKCPIAISDILYYYNRVSETSCVNSLSYGKWINCYEAFTVIRSELPANLLGHFKNEVATTKIKIYIETLKSIALCEKKISEQLKCYRLLENKGMIPSMNDTRKSFASFTLNIISIVAANILGYICFVRVFRIFKLKICQRNA